MTSRIENKLSAWMWVVAGLLMLGEFLLFDVMTSRHHASLYPRWNDQIQYLTESYNAYQQLQDHGLGTALQFTLKKTVPQGTLHDFFAVLIFWVTGSASRSAALSLNMLVFLAWQIALLAIIPRVTGSRTLAWLGFSLLLCLAWPWSGEAGSAVDFRLDHGAMCLMGITSTLALLTKGFRATKWAIAFGAAIGFTLLERFLTGAYFAGIFVASAIWISGGDQRGLRWRNLGLAGLTATLIALPVFWLNRMAIYTYYWVGHVSGAEGAARLRGFDLWHSLQFIFGHLGDMILGSYFGWTVAAFTAALLLLTLLYRRQADRHSQRDWLFLGLAFLLMPAAVLTMHRQKSEFVLGVLAPGVVLLVLWAWAALWQRIDFSPASYGRRFAPLLLALAALGTGGNYFYQRQLWQPHNEEFLASARKVNQIADHIYNSTRSAGLAYPNIAVDQVIDFFDAQILQVICYERHKTKVPFVIQLPNSILADKDEVMLYRLRLCDFVLLTEEMPGSGYWPYDQQMRRLYPELKSWCMSQLKLVETFTVFGRRMSLYQRPNLP